MGCGGPSPTPRDPRAMPARLGRFLALGPPEDDLLHRAPFHRRKGLAGRRRVPLVEGAPIAGHYLGDIIDRVDHLRGRVVERPLRLGPGEDQRASVRAPALDLRPMRLLGEPDADLE